MTSGFAENFVTLMLGWIRQVASSIASAFQSSGGKGSSFGASLLAWFADHWVGLLVALIVVGVIVDWVVWMLRWRPYWLWFHKRRMVLDDDIDEHPGEEALRRRYGLPREPRAPRFHSAALSRDGEDDELPGDYEPDDYEPDDYEPDDYEPDDYEPDDYEEPDAYAPGDEEPDDIEEPDDFAPEDSYDEADEEDEWADIPSKHQKKKQKTRLFGRRRPASRKREEDPFEIGENEIDEDDADFYSVVSEPPKPLRENAMMYARPETPAPAAPEATEETAEDEAAEENLEAEAALPRKARRARRQEAQNHSLDESV